MRKLLWIFVLLLFAGCLRKISSNIYYVEEEADTIIEPISKNDTAFFVITKNGDTVDWWRVYEDITFSKEDYERTILIVDSLLNLGYKKGSINY